MVTKASFIERSIVKSIFSVHYYKINTLTFTLKTSVLPVSPLKERCEHGSLLSKQKPCCRAISFRSCNLRMAQKVTFDITRIANHRKVRTVF